MGYHVVDSRAVTPAEDRPCELRRLSAAAGLSNVAINRFRVEPGEQIPLAYHYHDEQEEALYVLSGVLSVETPEGIHRIESGAAFVAEPESPHRAHNPADADAAVEVLAIGAPAVDDVHPYEPSEAAAAGGEE